MSGTIQPGQPVVCENYEITFGEDGQSVVLTFDVEDVPAKGMNHVRSLALTDDLFVATLASSTEADAQTQTIHFPVGPADGQLRIIADTIRDKYPTVYVAALGPAEDGDNSTIVFSDQVSLV